MHDMTNRGPSAHEAARSTYAGGLMRPAGLLFRTPPRPALAALLAFAAWFLLGQEAMGQTRELRMFVPDTDWPPYLINTPGHPGGVFVEVLREAVGSLGYTVVPVRLPNKRGWSMLDNGEVDVHIKAKDWVEDPDRYEWSIPFMKNENVLVYAADSDLKYDSPKSMLGKSIGTIKGFIYPALEPYFKDGRIRRVDCASPYTMLELVALHRIDAAVVNRIETLYLFRTEPNLHPERYRLDDTPCGVAWYRYLFPKGRGWNPLIGKLNKGLKAMMRDGRLDAILARYR